VNLFDSQLIRWNGDPDDPETARTERIIFIDESGIDLATIDVDNKNSKPKWYKYKDTIVALHNGEATLQYEDHRAPLTLTAEDLKKARYRKIKRVRDNRWEVIEPLVTGENEFKMLFPKERAALIAERTEVKFAHGKNSAEITYDRKSIYKFYYLWLCGGKTMNALLGRYLNSGALGQDRVQKEKKLGRPSKISKITEQPTGVVLTSAWLNIICFGALLFFNSKLTKGAGKKLIGIKTAYRNTLRHFCPKGKVCNKKGEWEIIIPDYTKGEVFSPRQFEYQVRKDIERNLQEFFRKKFGERKYKLRFRGLKGNSTSEAPYPGALYQIDATIADIYLVSRLNRLHVIGRPTIVVIIDVFSRMIVGVCIRFEREGWNVINLALKNATEDKVQFCQKHGIDITKNEWPVIGLCDAITGDRGPMIGYNADNLVAGLKIRVSNLPPYRADWKWIVEQVFRLLNIRVIDQLPGALNPEKERGDRDVRLDAVLDINQFTAILIKAIFYHNNHHYMDWYEMDKDMIASRVKPIPRELFLWGQSNRSGKPRYRDSESIRIHLLPGDEATVTRRGIRFKGEFYTCEKAEEEDWRFIARNKGTWKEDVAYDPRIPEIIYLRPKDGSPSIPCYLLNPDSIAAGSDLAEVEEYYERKQIEDQIAEVPDMQARVGLDVGIEAIVSEAEEMAATAQEDAPAESKASLLKGMSKRKQAEIALMDEEYRREILEGAGLTDLHNAKQTPSADSDSSVGKYVPRPRLANVLSIQERMMDNHVQEK
jgi:putative transposase